MSDLKVHLAEAACGRAAIAASPRLTSNPAEVTCKYCRGEVRRADVRPCGTLAAYRRHHRHGEKPCASCTQAKTRYDQDRKALAA